MEPSPTGTGRPREDPAVWHPPPQSPSLGPPYRVPWRGTGLGARRRGEACRGSTGRSHLNGLRCCWGRGSTGGATSQAGCGGRTAHQGAGNTAPGPEARGRGRQGPPTGPPELTHGAPAPSPRSFRVWAGPGLARQEAAAEIVHPPACTLPTPSLRPPAPTRAHPAHQEHHFQDTISRTSKACLVRRQGSTLLYLGFFKQVRWLENLSNVA